MSHEPLYQESTHLVRPLRTGSIQSSAQFLLVQLLQGRPPSGASHLTLRARQGTHALLALRARFPVTPALCGSLPEAEGLLLFIKGAVYDQGIEWLAW
jgi:hypothetical protein